MEWWQIVLILLASIVVGAVVGALLSYLISRFDSKRATTLLSDFTSRFGKKPEAPETSSAPEEVVSDGLYHGRVALEITAPIDFTQMIKLQAYLRAVPDLQLASVGGSAAGDAMIIVIADKPLPLVSILSEMPLAKDVIKKERNIQMALEIPQPA